MLLKQYEQDVISVSETHINRFPCIIVIVWHLEVVGMRMSIYESSTWAVCSNLKVQIPWCIARGNGAMDCECIGVYEPREWSGLFDQFTVDGFNGVCRRRVLLRR